MFTVTLLYSCITLVIVCKIGIEIYMHFFSFLECVHYFGGLSAYTVHIIECHETK